jgi:hypothetical protein
MAEAYLTFKGTTAGVVDAFYPKQALADAGATDDDITAVQGVKTIPDNYRPNKAYWDGTDLLEETPESVVFDALPDEDQAKERREYCFDLLRAHEAIGGKLSVWHASRVDNVAEGDPPEAGDEDERLDQSKRFASYGRWLEANVRVVLVDANLLSALFWPFIKAECEIPGETWYWLHKVNGTQNHGGWYEIYRDNNRTEWVWHYTTGTSVDSNSRIGVRVVGGDDPVMDTDADWVKELR